ncbi:MAG: hypothetical protein HDS87_00745 [Bacteroidales bacterium]|nr:hypothetical protein [Bacteroidales bacterium]
MDRLTTPATPQCGVNSYPLHILTRSSLPGSGYAIPPAITPRSTAAYPQKLFQPLTRNVRYSAQIMHLRVMLYPRASLMVSEAVPNPSSVLLTKSNPASIVVNLSTLLCVFQLEP